MSEQINSDLIRGSVNTIVLRSLFESDRYGYEIIKYVEEQTNGQYVLKQPTLYSSLRRLENMGFVSFYWGEETHGGRRKYYTLTDLGRSVFEKNQNEYRFSREMIDKLVTESGATLQTKTDEVAETKDVPAIKENTEDRISEKAENIGEQNKEQASSETVDRNFIDEKAVDAVPDVDVSVSHAPVIDAVEVQVRETDRTDEKIELSSEPETETYHSKIKADQISGVEKFREMFAELNKNGYAQKASEDVPVQKNETFGSGYFPDKAPEESSEYSLDSTDYNTLDADGAFPSFGDSDKPFSAETSTENAYKPTDNFYSYDAPASIVADESGTGYDDYKTKLSSIFNPEVSESVSDTSAETAATTAAAPSEENAISLKERIMVRSFGKITENVKQLGEEVKIRTPDVKSAKKYNEQFYYYRNKLLLYKYGAMFLLMMMEILLTFVIIRGFAKIRTDSDVTIYVLCILFSLAFPVAAAAMYLHEPKKRKRLEFNLKTSLIFRIIIMLQVDLIVYALNVYFGMPIGGSSSYALSVALPIVISTNIPVAAVIFNGLYKSKKFAVK